MTEEERKQYMKEFGQRVKMYREKLGMTQRELSIKAGYVNGTNPASTIYKIENGQIEVTQTKVAEIAEASDGSVIEIGRCKLAVCLFCSTLISESSFIHFNSYCLVGVAERHTVEGAAVDFLDGKEVVIYRGVEDAFLHGDMLEHIICHIEAFVHKFKGKEEYVLHELELSVVSMRHIAAEHRDLSLG